MPQHTTQLTIRNDIAQIAVVRDALDRFAASEGIPQKALWHLQIAIDEIVSNIIKYAWPEGGAHEVNVRMAAEGDVVHVEVVDDGQPFDPLTAPPPPRVQGRRPRPGGLGIHMVRQLVDTLVYERAGKRNHIFITKRCTLSAPSH